MDNKQQDITVHINLSFMNNRLKSIREHKGEIIRRVCNILNIEYLRILQFIA